MATQRWGHAGKLDLWEGWALRFVAQPSSDMPNTKHARCQVYECLIRYINYTLKGAEWSHRTKSHQVWLLLNLSAFLAILKSGHQKSGMRVCVVCNKALSQGVLNSHADSLGF